MSTKAGEVQHTKIIVPDRNSPKSFVEPPWGDVDTLNTLFKNGQYAEAALKANSLLAEFPTSGICYKTLGAIFRQQGKLSEALAAMRQAVTLLPNDAVAHYNLAVVLKQQALFAEAQSMYKKVLMFEPNFAPAHLGLGQALQSQQKFQEAEISYRQALKSKPDFVEAFNNLAQLFSDRGDWLTGLRLANQYVQALGNRRAKSFFVQCVTRANPKQIDELTQKNILRGLAEPWCNPIELVRVATNLLKVDVMIQPLLGRVLEARSKHLYASEYLGADSLEGLAGNSLLKMMLVSAPICDISLERLLTTIRISLLDRVGIEKNDIFPSNAEMGFYCALASQCFINEYVYACTDDEIARASELRDELIYALDQGIDIPEIRVVAVAVYFSLNKLPDSERLLRRVWSSALAEMLKLQVTEPAEERRLMATVPRLTAIDGEVSLAVQNMYEENPYPRWIKRLFGEVATPVNDLLSTHFPITFQPLDKEHDFEVLVAGCGTGQHSISTARQYKYARILAIDLSLASLVFAKRKSQELGLTNVDYAQADIMRLAELNRSFDVIESCGVLHHLGDPWAGWRVLLSMLRHGGVMNIALYSEIARRDVVRGRELIAQRGYASTIQGIRQCRQDMMDSNTSENFAYLMTSDDFYSASNCRDLLFHVQEHRMTLLQIKAFLKENNLVFLGFQEKPETIAAYRKRFPDDQATTNLDQWHIFEQEHPHIFIRMYQFWLQKPK